MRIATYTRISTDEVNQPYSLAAQAERLAAYIASQDGWERVQSYSDQASGAKLERPGLKRALADAALSRFDVLLVYRVDRLCRSVGLLADLLSRLDAAGVGFRSATEPFETTTPSGRMMMQMLGVFAEFERASIIERVVMGMGRKAAEGRWVGGTQPFGYRRAPEGGRLVAEPTEAALVPLIFDLYAHQLHGNREIAARLNEAGHRTRSGRPFSWKSVLTILKNRVYLGEVGWRGEWFPGEHEPLVDPDVFGKAEVLLQERGEDAAKRVALSSDYLLTGLVVCSCGARFIGTAATGRSRSYRYYTCGTRQRYGTKTCSAARLPADILDEAVVNGLLDVLSDTALVEEAARRARERSTASEHLVGAELATVDAELGDVETSIDRYLTSFERGALPEEVCGPRLKALSERARALRERREELAAEQEEASIVAPAPEELAGLREEVEAAMVSGSPAQVKALLQALVHEVRVHDGETVQPVFKLPAGTGTTAMEAVRAPSRLVEVAGIEPASFSFAVGLLRAQPAVRSRVPPRHRHRHGTPVS